MTNEHVLKSFAALSFDAKSVRGAVVVALREAPISSTFDEGPGDVESTPEEFRAVLQERDTALLWVDLQAPALGDQQMSTRITVSFLPAASFGPVTRRGRGFLWRVRAGDRYGRQGCPTGRSDRRRTGATASPAGGSHPPASPDRPRVPCWAKPLAWRPGSAAGMKC